MRRGVRSGNRLGLNRPGISPRRRAVAVVDKVWAAVWRLAFFPALRERDGVTGGRCGDGVG